MSASGNSGPSPAASAGPGFRMTPALLTDVDRYLDDHAGAHGVLGRHLFEALEYDREKGRISSQIRSLQNIACSATRFSDVEDFVKNQMGKSGQAADKWRRVGDEVLESLQTLRDAAGALCPAGSGGAEAQLQVRLKLARGWVRAAVSEYLYCVARDQMERGPRKGPRAARKA